MSQGGGKREENENVTAFSAVVQLAGLSLVMVQLNSYSSTVQLQVNPFPLHVDRVCFFLIPV